MEKEILTTRNEKICGGDMYALFKYITARTQEFDYLKRYDLMELGKELENKNISRSAVIAKVALGRVNDISGWFRFDFDGNIENVKPDVFLRDLYDHAEDMAEWLIRNQDRIDLKQIDLNYLLKE